MCDRYHGASPYSGLTFPRNGGIITVSEMLTRLAKVTFWAALVACGLVDFVTTVSLSIIVIGIGGACKCALSEADYLSALFS